MRMSELKGYSTQDPLKSEADTESYHEFKDLQKQLYDISRMSIIGKPYSPGIERMMVVLLRILLIPLVTKLEPESNRR